MLALGARPEDAVVDVGTGASRLVPQSLVPPCSSAVGR